MNSVHPDDEAKELLADFHGIADDRIRHVADQRKILRGERRAAAINAVDLAREHAGNKGTLYSQSEADVIVAIQELLDRVSEADHRQ